MFVNAAVPLLLFFFALLWTKVQVQGVHGVKGCPSFSTSISCYWSGCCEMYCGSHTISCQIYHKTAGSVSWCIVKVNETLTPVINITFNSSAGSCASCTSAHEDNMCCGTSSNDTVIPINCFTVSVYSPLTPSSTVIPPVSSVLLMGTHLSLTNTHFTTSTINSVQATPYSSVPATTNSIIVVVPAVVALILLVVLTSVIAISCILVVMHKKHSKGKQTKAQKQNCNMNVDMTECEAYGKLEVNSEKIDMTSCSAYGTLQTLQNAVHPEYEDVATL